MSGIDGIDYLGDNGRQIMLDFQHLCRATAVYPSRGMPVGKMYAALGLCGEAGETAEEIKKMWRNHEGAMTPDRRDRIKNELGDTFWYLAVLCEECGLELGDVAEHVIQKLQIRSATGALKHE